MSDIDYISSVTLCVREPVKVLDMFQDVVNGSVDVVFVFVGAVGAVGNVMVVGRVLYDRHF